VGSRAGLDTDVAEKRKIFPCRKPNPSLPAYAGHYNEKKNVLSLLGIKPDTQVQSVD
jgi:hypothetical protein